MAAATVTLPVRLSIGEHAVEAGTITLDLTRPTGPQLAEALHAVADALDNDERQEVSTDGTA